MPSLASPATGTDAQKWLAMACNWCIDRKIDVLLESACRNLDELTSLISDFHVAGYRVNVAIMAVPECLSILGTMVRHYKKLSEAQSDEEPLRLTPRSVHYETYGNYYLAAIEPYLHRIISLSGLFLFVLSNLRGYLTDNV